MSCLIANLKRKNEEFVPESFALLCYNSQRYPGIEFQLPISTYDWLVNVIVCVHVDPLCFRYANHNRRCTVHAMLSVYIQDLDWRIWQVFVGKYVDDFKVRFSKLSILINVSSHPLLLLCQSQTLHARFNHCTPQIVQLPSLACGKYRACYVLAFHLIYWLIPNIDSIIPQSDVSNKMFQAILCSPPTPQFYKTQSLPSVFSQQDNSYLLASLHKSF